MKKIVVTGVSGFLGSRMVEFLKEKYEVLAPTHKEMDITEEESVKQYFKKHKPDIVIHCAAISDVGTCEKEKELSWKVNVVGSENIVKIAKMFSAKCICCSSDQVYCGSKEVEVNKEESILNLTNVYGTEKACAEKSCMQIDSTSVHLRLAWMYDANDTKRNDFIKQLRNCIKESKPLYLSPNDKRGITDVWEVVQNIEKTFELDGGIYHFGSPNTKSTYELARDIFKKLGYDTSLICKMDHTNQRNLTMSQEKINQFGIYFSSTEEGILRCLS
ncbi:MAG: NAD(P)-dependent oxidoreductase [Lachnospiraceae bacterium]|nr:NAD(P)-dependent oxidoreductase [Lachnospiraceae bacterium]